MVSAINIREAMAADLLDVYDLVRELAVYEDAAEELTASLDDYFQDFEDGVFDVLVAEADGSIVGMALFYLTYSTWKGRMLYLEDFVVRAPYRRYGVGQLLFDRLMLVAQERDCRLVKWQVLDWNEPAIKFYEKNEATIERNWWTCKVLMQQPAAVPERKKNL